MSLSAEPKPLLSEPEPASTLHLKARGGKCVIHLKETLLWELEPDEAHTFDAGGANGLRIDEVLVSGEEGAEVIGYYTQQ